MSTGAPPVHPADLDDVLMEANEAHCAGDFAAAEQGYASVLAASPGSFIVLNLLGALCGQTGRHQEAIGYLRRAAALRPSDPEIQRNLGIAHEMAGDMAQAAAQYARAVALAPNFAEAHFSLGVCHEAAGEIAAALDSYRRAADLAPGHAPAQNNLGTLLSDRDPAAAEAALRRAIALDPAYPEPRNNLGALLLSHGRAAEACPVLEEAVALRPGYADAMINLGMALCSLGRRDEGIARLRAAAAADAGTLPRLALAGMLGEYGGAGEAEALLRGVLAEEPDNDAASLRLADRLAPTGRHAEAEALLRGVLARAPDHAEAALALAELLHQSGRFAEAEALLTPFAEAGPRRGTASLSRVRTRRMLPSDRAAIDALEALAAQPDLSVTERVAALFALGKAHDDLGDPAAAMRALDRGNALQRAQEPRFDRAGHAAFVDRLIATYTPAFLAARRAWGSPSRRPLLIVGMMRSGTTLMEQVLAAHPAVAAGGELTFWPQHAGAGAAPPADAGAAAALIAGYLGQLDRIDARAARVTDKLPHNVYAAGLIHLLFPHARILHCRRAPADIGLSLYRALFATPHPYAYDQGDIVFLLRQYERLAAHWRAVLPAETMLEVPYETLVTAPAATARHVLAFCGLDWDARVLEHAAHDRPIRTASAWQARQAITATAIGSARRYAPWLAELATLLEPEPEPEPPGAG